MSIPIIVSLGWITYKNDYKIDTSNRYDLNLSKAASNSKPILIPKVQISIIDKFASTSHSSDGEVTFNLQNFDPSIMTIRKESQFGILENYDPVSHSIKVSNLENNNNIRLSINLNEGYQWNDGLMGKQIFEHILHKDMIEVLIPKFISMKIKSPSVSNLNDGEVIFILENFNPNTMTIIKKSQNGILGKYNSMEHSIKVSGLAENQSAQISILLKLKDALWEDKSFRPITSSNITIQKVMHGLRKPTIKEPIIHKTSSTTSNDGFVIYPIANFDPSTMIVHIPLGMPGRLESYDQINKQIKISNLNEDDITRIEIFPNDNENWDDRTTEQIYSKIAIVKSNEQSPMPITELNHPILQVISKSEPTYPYYNNGWIKIKAINFNPIAMESSIVSHLSGRLSFFNSANSTFTISGLHLNESTQLEIKLKNNFKWSDWSQNTYLSEKITMKSRAEIEYIHNINNLSINNELTQITLPSDSAASNGKVKFSISNFNENTMLISLTSKSTNGVLEEYNKFSHTVSISKLKDGDIVQIKILDKKSLLILQESQLVNVDDLKIKTNNIHPISTHNLKGNNTNKILLIGSSIFAGGLLVSATSWKIISNKTKRKI